MIQASSVQFLEPQCSPSYSTPRIVGGRSADILGNPWMVLLKTRVGDFIKLCGGSLITNRK